MQDGNPSLKTRLDQGILGKACTARQQKITMGVGGGESEFVPPIMNSPEYMILECQFLLNKLDSVIFNKNEKYLLILLILNLI